MVKLEISVTLMSVVDTIFLAPVNAARMNRQWHGPTDNDVEWHCWGHCGKLSWDADVCRKKYLGP